MAAPELQAVLEQLLEPDNAVIQRVTDTGRRSGGGHGDRVAQLTSPLHPPFFPLGHRSSLRQLAAVLLRRRLSGGRWRRLDPELRLSGAGLTWSHGIGCCMWWAWPKSGCG
uniref:Uncharacterized protein n=1 Tax=Pavo cristatus TaxID=9049 RepID=A0A8C9F065_PAVCR